MERFAEKPATMNKRRKQSEKANVTTSGSDNIQCFKCGAFGHMWKQCPDKRKCKTCGSHLSANHRDNFKKSKSNNNRKESANNASNNNGQTKRNSGKPTKFKKNNNKSEKRTNLKQKMKNRLKEERVNSNENQNCASDNEDADSANMVFEESDELVEECYQSVLIDVNDPMLRSKMIIDSGATSHMIIIIIF
jgi:hypothetical protein